MEGKNWTIIRKIIYAVTLVAACLPLACGYVMEGGDILIWLARIEETADGLASGQFRMFPSAELIIAHSGQFSALNSNLWLLLPAAMRLAGMSVTFVYRIYMLLLNCLGFFAAKRLFDNLFQDKTTAAFGVLLYMTCPYRVYLYYDKAALGMAAAWALIPFVLGEALLLKRGKVAWKRIAVMAVAAALVGYGDGILMLSLVGVMVLHSLWSGKWIGLVPVLAGGCLYLPGAIYWLRYVLKGGMEVWSLPLGSIAAKGYSLGQFFSGWAYMADKPGLGLGVMGALAVLCWVVFTEKGCAVGKRYSFYVLLMGLMLLMSMHSFFWDFVQRLGTPFLRLVGLIETPGIFFGFAALASAVLGAYGVECAQKKEKLFVKIGMPLILAMAAVGSVVYLCNMLTYTRVPMFL